MKLFVSIDIEGVSITPNHDFCDKDKPFYALSAQAMTQELLAFIEGATGAGATEILVKDAHASATNIDPLLMPGHVTLERGWSGHPYLMSEGIDSSFDAAAFLGYHSPAGSGGSPLAHTVSGKTSRVLLNGKPCSEFMLYSYAAALEGVPTVLLSGDLRLCEDSKDLHPGLFTVPTKEGFGGLVKCYSPQRVREGLREAAGKAVSQDLGRAKISLPEHFSLEICYKVAETAYRMQFFPGCRLKDDLTVVFESDSFYDVLNAAGWIL